MKTRLALLLLGLVSSLLSLSVWSADPSCSRYTSSSAVFLTYTKTMNAKNVLKFSIKHDADCMITGPVTPFWIMGEENGQCEGLANNEKKYFQPTNARASSSTVSYSLGILNLINQKQNAVQVDDEFELTLMKNANGACVPLNALTITEPNRRVDVNVTSFHAKVAMLSIDEVVIQGLLPMGVPYKSVVAID